MNNRKVIKIINSITLIVMFFVTSNISFADNGSAGKFTIKARVIGVITGNKQVDNNKINADSSVATYTSSMGNSLGAEISANYFLSDNIAAEISLGFFKRKIRTGGNIIDIGNNNNISIGEFDQLTYVKYIPVTTLVQYHIAPYGKISPYIGAGYGWLISSASSGSRVNNSGAPVLQLGVDSWLKDDTFINIDIKKYFATTKLNYSKSKSFVPINTELKINPLIISFGMGYRF